MRNTAAQESSQQLAELFIEDGIPHTTLDINGEPIICIETDKGDVYVDEGGVMFAPKQYAAMCCAQKILRTHDYQMLRVNPVFWKGKSREAVRISG